jgi:hypothetical protein
VRGYSSRERCSAYRFKRVIFNVPKRERQKAREQAALPRANYLLSGKLFCGHCKKKMTGVSGTGKLGGKFYYYYCPSARSKNGCDKKHVPKNWLEELVVAETVRHILQPEAMTHIAKAGYEIQLEYNAQDSEVEFLRQRLADNQKALTNTIRAIESGVETTSLPIRLRELEIERLQLSDELKGAEARQLIISPEHIEFLLRQYVERGDADEHEYRKRIINGLVSEVYLYDNCLLIYYNINKNQPNLASSDLALVESSGFDQQDLCFTLAFSEYLFSALIFAMSASSVYAVRLARPQSL